MDLVKLEECILKVKDKVEVNKLYDSGKLMIASYGFHGDYMLKRKNKDDITEIDLGNIKIILQPSPDGNTKISFCDQQYVTSNNIIVEIKNDKLLLVVR
ncbi:hypothetical protein SBV1_gp41 [Sulfolobales Beppu virus 1]|nr:hypothetical protein SBV1_gp41 [Sulfolobales Beppu virus 1]